MRINNIKLQTFKFFRQCTAVRRIKLALVWVSDSLLCALYITVLLCKHAPVTGIHSTGSTGYFLWNQQAYGQKFISRMPVLKDLPPIIFSPCPTNGTTKLTKPVSQLVFPPTSVLFLLMTIIDKQCFGMTRRASQSYYFSVIQ